MKELRVVEISNVLLPDLERECQRLGAIVRPVPNGLDSVFVDTIETLRCEDGVYAQTYTTEQPTRRAFRRGIQVLQAVMKTIYGE